MKTPVLFVVGPANSGKTWMRTVVFERRLPLDLVLERRESKVVVTKMSNTDLLSVDIWGKLVSSAGNKKDFDTDEFLSKTGLEIWSRVRTGER